MSISMSMSISIWDQPRSNSPSSPYYWQLPPLSYGLGDICVDKNVQRLVEMPAILVHYIAYVRVGVLRRMCHVCIRYEKSAKKKLENFFLIIIVGNYYFSLSGSQSQGEDTRSAGQRRKLRS